jgi:hypothetical protein
LNKVIVRHRGNEQSAVFLSGVAVSVVASLLCLIAIETAADFLLPNPYELDKRLLFFSAGLVFQNTSWGGFVYQPNSRIHVQALYITDPKGPTVSNEFKYLLRTNSSGLVQLADIIPSKPSICAFSIF